MSELQWHDAGPRGDGYCWAISEYKHEAQATWRTPQGFGRYRIWSRSSSVTGSHYYDLVRLKPSSARLDGRPLKFSGRQLAAELRSMDEAKTIAEADNARLCAEIEAAEREQTQQKEATP